MLSADELADERDRGVSGSDARCEVDTVGPSDEDDPECGSSRQAQGAEVWSYRCIPRTTRWSKPRRTEMGERRTRTSRVLEWRCVRWDGRCPSELDWTLKSQTETEKAKLEERRGGLYA